MSEQTVEMVAPLVRLEAALGDLRDGRTYPGEAGFGYRVVVFDDGAVEHVARIAARLGFPAPDVYDWPDRGERGAVTGGRWQDAWLEVRGYEPLEKPAVSLAKADPDPGDGPEPVPAGAVVAEAVAP
jgi:hypothetical protein